MLELVVNTHRAALYLLAGHFASQQTSAITAIDMIRELQLRPKSTDKVIQQTWARTRCGTIGGNCAAEGPSFRDSFLTQPASSVMARIVLQVITHSSLPSSRIVIKCALVYGSILVPAI